jgi:hypothetical protein
MAGIVALRGIGDDAATAAPAEARPKLPLTTILIWAASVGAVGYMFWATVFSPPKRKRARAGARA